MLVACTFSGAATAGTNLTINDQADAVWHSGAARNVSVTVSRSNGSTAGKLTITSAATSATNLAITNLDVNHSIEFATSSAGCPAMTVACTAPYHGLFIDPGTFIKSVTGTTVTLSRATLAGGPLCPGSPAPATCATSVAATVLISNTNARDARDGVTTANSNILNSNGAHFCKPALGTECTTARDDTGSFISGGDIPDGATILSVNSKTQVTMQCVGCFGGPGIGAFSTSAASGLTISITPNTAPTSARYVTDASFSGTTITSSSAKFARTDIGLAVVGNPATAVPAGTRITAVAATGGSATVSQTLAAGTNRKITIGKPTKTAPATGDIVGSLAISLKVDPTASPTSPPCAADKPSGFQIPLTWKNPGAYDLTNNAAQVGGNTQFSGTVVSPTSIGQFDFLTSATTFAGFLKQTVTVASTVPTTTAWQVKFEFLPVGVGLCTGTGIAETIAIIGISNKQATNPSFTGGGSGAVRGLLPMPQGSQVTYSGTGANNGIWVTTSGGTPAGQTNACTVVSPNPIQIGCRTAAAGDLVP